MQPEQPQPPQQPDYNFIMNPEPASRRPLFGMLGSGTKARLGFIAAVIVVIIIILIVLAKAVGGSGGVDKVAFLSVLQDQSELVHLSQTGLQDATTPTMQNFSATVSASMPSEQTAILNYLTDNHYKPSSKALAAKELTATDTQLQSAQSSSTFDGTYSDVMQQQFKTYESDLSAAYQTAGPKGKTVLKARYSNAQLLLTQLAGN